MDTHAPNQPTDDRNYQHPKRPRLDDKSCKEITRRLRDVSSPPLEQQGHIHVDDGRPSVEEKRVGRKSPHLNVVDPQQGRKDIARDDGWIESCYGMLYGILVRSKSPSSAPITSSTNHPVSFQAPNKLSVLENGTMGFEIQSPTCARILKELHDLEEISMQLFCYSWLEIQRQISSHPTKRQKEKAHQVWRLNVIIYGTVALEDIVGQYLSKHRMYLQDPVDCTRNVIYRNPHMITRGDTIVMTESFVALAKSVEIEQLSIGPELLAQLMEEQIPLKATEPPQIVTTQLFCHQKQALTFMMRREQGWDVGSNLDVWTKEQSHPGYFKYRNNVNGACQSKPPPVFRGGLLADDMGLGKTLSMISLIATDNPSINGWSQPNTNVDRDTASPYSKSTLLVVPPSLIHAWRKQFAAHVRPDAIDLHMYHGQKKQSIESFAQQSVVITTYQTLSSIWRKTNHKKSVDLIFSVIWHRVILDEAHIIQNAESCLAQACRALQAERRWAITGTPIQNKLTDFSSIIKFLRVYPYNEMPVFDEEISRPWHQSNPEGFLRLKTLVRAITISRTKTVVELPPRLDEVHRVNFSTKERNAYDSANKDTIALFEEVLSSRGDGGKKFNALSRLNHLRKFCNLGLLAPALGPVADTQIQICSQPAYDCGVLLDEILDRSATCTQCEGPLLEDFLDGGSTPISEASPFERQFVQVCGKCRSSEPPSNLNQQAVHEQLATTSILNGNDGDDRDAVTNESLPTKLKALVADLTKYYRDEKCVVFSYWTSTLDVVQLMLQGSGIAYTRVDGKISLAKRSEAIRSFQIRDDTRVILVSITCGGAGLDLTAGSRAYLLEPHWNPMTEEQALCRVHRVGQKRRVTTIRYIILKSFEEQVVEIQKRKRKLAEITFGSGQLSEGGIGMGTLQYLKSVLE